MQTSNINKVSQKQQKYELVDDVKLNHFAVKYYQKQKFIDTLKLNFHLSPSHLQREICHLCICAFFPKITTGPIHLFQM